MQKKRESIGTIVAVKDLRGKHSTRPHKYPTAIKSLIIAHIKRFPTVESHYRREDTLRNYLPEGLNVAKMRRMLIEEIHKAGIKNIDVSRHYYRDIFNQNFNYGFHKPKEDRYKNKNIF